MTQQFLNASQVRAALQQMRRSGMPQPVRPKIADARDSRQSLVDNAARRPRIKSASSRSQQQGRRTAGDG